MAAITELYNTYKQDVLNYLYFLTKDAELSQDLLQETFLKAQVLLMTFRAQSSIKTWLFSIARNCFIDSLRKKSPESELDEDILVAASIVSDSFVITAENKDMAERLLKILDDKSRTIVIKRIYGYSFAEIAEKVNMSENSSRVVYHRAVKKLKKFAIENEFEF